MKEKVLESKEGRKKYQEGEKEGKKKKNGRKNEREEEISKVKKEK